MIEPFFVGESIVQFVMDVFHLGYLLYLWSIVKYQVTVLSRDIPGLFLDADQWVVGRLARALKPNSVVVEIGSFCGKSTLTWLENNKDLWMHCVDPWSFDFWSKTDFIRWAQDRRLSGTPEMIQQAFKQAKHSWHDAFAWFTREHSHRITAYQTTSDQVILDVMRDPEIIFIDGDHTREQCLSDMRKFSLYENSLLVVHDRDLPGVSQALDCWGWHDLFVPHADSSIVIVRHQNWPNLESIFQST